ncbi:MAG: hypothetical protein GXO91_05160 [FCB group bacterium]|nr:hypothetical protein [FCB group bacterium]
MNLNAETEQNWEPFIGLQIRISLATRTKLFCTCENRSGMLANSLICPHCLGVPATAPKVNREALAKALKLGLALNCKTNKTVVFDRKYTSMEASPKGYQITQLNYPLCYDGYLNLQLNGGLTRISIKTIHLEEDVAELKELPGESFIDFNRSGAPVVVISTRNKISSADAAYLFLNRLMQWVTYLKIANLQDVSRPVRCRATVCLGDTGNDRYIGGKEFPEMVSFHALRRALKAEIQRQRHNITGKIRTLYGDEVPVSAGNETDPANSSQRNATRAETSIAPILISEAFLDKLRSEIPELPEDKEIRLVYRYGINRTQADMISADPLIADYFENLVTYVTPLAAVKWLLGAVFHVMSEQQISISEFPISSRRLGELINHLEQNSITVEAARAVFQQMLEDPRSSTEIIVDKMLYIREDYDKLFAVPQRRYSQNADSDQQGDADEIQSLYLGQVWDLPKKKSDIKSLKALNPKIVKK